MTHPRGEVYKPGETGSYHCIARCVRRAFLCGVDSVSARSYEHRKGWIQDRLKFLLDIFAIECSGYAVMDNHLHTVLHTTPELTKTWSATDVTRRWLTLFPQRGLVTHELFEEEVNRLSSIPTQVEEFRERLGNLSWFQRCLNENIARRANKEDSCTGRFWEGRFKSIRLEGSTAVLMTCVYVDLNPIRANIATTPEESQYTSIKQRIAQYKGDNCAELPKLCAHSSYCGQEMSEELYMSLVDQTGRIVKEGKGSIPVELRPILTRLGVSEAGWLESARSNTRLFCRIVGDESSLRRVAADNGRSHMHGLSVARSIFI